MATYAYPSTDPKISGAYLTTASNVYTAVSSGFNGTQKGYGLYVTVPSNLPKGVYFLKSNPASVTTVNNPKVEASGSLSTIEQTGSYFALLTATSTWNILPGSSTIGASRNVVNNGTGAFGGMAYGNGFYFVKAASGNMGAVSTNGNTWATVVGNGVPPSANTGTGQNYVSYVNPWFVYYDTNVVSGGVVYISTNATTWTTRLTIGSTGSIYSFAYSGTWYVGNAARGFLLSTNFTTWTSVPNTGLTGGGNNIRWNNQYFTIGLGSAQFALSTNGSTWTTRTTGSPYAIDNIVYGNGMYVAQGKAGAANLAGTIYISSDLTTWTNKSFLTYADYPLTALEFGNGYFIAVAPGGNNNYSNYYSSTDGNIWTHRPGSDNTSLGITIIWGNNRWLFNHHNGTNVGSFYLSNSNTPAGIMDNSSETVLLEQKPLDYIL